MPFAICLAWLRTAPANSLRFRSSRVIENRLSLLIRAHGGRLHALYWTYPQAIIHGGSEERIVLIIEAQSEATVRKLDMATEEDGYAEEEIVLVSPLQMTEKIVDALSALGDFAVVSSQQMYRSEHVTRGGEDKGYA
jgi:hypothetical protein